MNQSRLNRIFGAMWTRCYNPNFKNYANYGGRGITICDEWIDKTFIIVKGIRGTKGWFAFKEWALSHGYNDNLTIDRIDSNKNYSPENCRWATYEEQGNNTRRNFIVTFHNETHTLSQWAKIVGISYGVLKRRIYRGWDIERALTTK